MSAGSWSESLDRLRQRLGTATGPVPVVYGCEQPGEAEWIWRALSPLERERVAFRHRDGSLWLRCACGAPASLGVGHGQHVCTACAAHRVDVAELAVAQHVAGHVGLLDIAAAAADKTEDP